MFEFLEAESSFSRPVASAADAEQIINLPSGLRTPCSKPVLNIWCSRSSGCPKVAAASASVTMSGLPGH
jgi:hypothetical protein